MLEGLLGSLRRYEISKILEYKAFEGGIPWSDLTTGVCMAHGTPMPYQVIPLMVNKGCPRITHRHGTPLGGVFFFSFDTIDV